MSDRNVRTEGNLSLREDANGNVILENTANGTKLSLGAEVDVSGLTNFGDSVHNSIESNSLNAEKAQINRFGESADYTIVQYDGPTYAAIDRNNSVQFEGDKLHNVLQGAIDDRNGRQSHFHFTNPRGHGQGAYIYEQSVTWNLISVTITGGGRNKSQHTLADGANTDIWVFDSGDGSNMPIYEIRNVKFTGNKSNNTSGSAIVNRTANEINMDMVEFRSFAEHGFKYVPQNEVQWNNWQDVWVLDNDKAGIYVGSDGGTVTELNLVGSTICGGPEGSQSDGKHGLRIVDGSGTDNMTLTGCTLKGSESVRIENATDVNIVGGQGKDLFGDYAVSIGESTGTVFDANVKNVTFRADSAGSVTNFVRVGSNADKTVLEGNQFHGHGGAAIAGAGVGTAGVKIRNNENFVTEATSIRTFSSGSSSRNFGTDLDVDPQDGDVTATPTANWNSSAAAKYEVVASSVTDGFGIRMDADPTQNVDFIVHEQVDL